MIASQSLRDGEMAVARVGVRHLANEMGVAKNTAARATRLLLDQGLLVRSQRRTGAGRFESGLYELALPLGTLVVTHTDPSANRPADRALGIPKRARTSEPSRSLAVEQLVLLPQ